MCQRQKEREEVLSHGDLQVHSFAVHERQGENKGIDNERQRIKESIPITCVFWGAPTRADKPTTLLIGGKKLNNNKQTHKTQQICTPNFPWTFTLSYLILYFALFHFGGQTKGSNGINQVLVTNSRSRLAYLGWRFDIIARKREMSTYIVFDLSTFYLQIFLLSKIRFASPHNFQSQNKALERKVCIKICKKIDKQLVNSL